MSCLKVAALSVCISACALRMDARVTKINIEKRESPAYKGQAFGAAGQYELISGHFSGELWPSDQGRNSIITDLALAPRNSQGMVEYTATFAIAKPIDMSKASSVLVYTVTNRGGGAPVASAAGHVSAMSGWQADIVSRGDNQTIAAPVARNKDGSPVVGPVMARFMNAPAGTTTLALTAAVSGLVYQRPLSLDTSKATLNTRAMEEGANTRVSNGDWAFADCTKTPFPGVPDASKVCVKGGFDPALLYELTFVAKDPLIMGIGYAATRDFNSFLRYAEKDDAGTPNPVAKQIKFVTAEGNSQSGNFIRSFIHLGFNQDEDGRIVWDGVNPHIAVRQLALNYRFAVGGGVALLYEPGSDGVVWWSDYPDELRHRPAAGLLDRCRASNTCPKVLETLGGVEFWDLRASPDFVGTDAKKDIPLPENVRRYYFPSTTHGGGRGGFNVAAPAAPNGCAIGANPNPEAEQMKALRAALIDWVAKGTEPPPSRYPRLDRGELVDAGAVAKAFPAIPGAPRPDGLVNPLYDYDLGSSFRYNDLSGVISQVPPAIKRTLPMVAPKVDADGNEGAGVPSVLLQAPLGSYLGWNVTAAGFNKGKICGLNGGYVPFAVTKAERLAAKDPRLSLEERYRNHAGYVAAVKKAAGNAVRERFLLQEDADRLVQEASDSGVLTGTGSR